MIITFYLINKRDRPSEGQRSPYISSISLFLRIFEANPSNVGLIHPAIFFWAVATSSSVMWGPLFAESCPHLVRHANMTNPVQL